MHSFVSRDKLSQLNKREEILQFRIFRKALRRWKINFLHSVQTLYRETFPFAGNSKAQGRVCAGVTSLWARKKSQHEVQCFDSIEKLENLAFAFVAQKCS